jgi:hypothetical protein
MENSNYITEGKCKKYVGRESVEGVGPWDFFSRLRYQLKLNPFEYETSMHSNSKTRSNFS